MTPLYLTAQICQEVADLERRYQLADLERQLRHLCPRRRRWYAAYLLRLLAK